MKLLTEIILESLKDPHQLPQDGGEQKENEHDKQPEPTT